MLTGWVEHTMNDLTDEESRSWFKNQPLDQGYFRINAYTTTSSLANMVELAIGNVRRGKSIARTNLLEVKAKLEAQVVP